MPYTSEEIRKKVAENKNAASLNSMKLHQSRIKFHTVKHITAFHAPFLSYPLTQFMAMVENILPHDKFVLFKTLFRFPVKTNEITETCFDKLSRIFDGRNPVFNYQFVSQDLRDDWEYYRAKKLHEPEVWKTKGWEFFKSEINSVLIVDVAREQTTDLPEPYFYWLPVCDIISYKADRDTGVMDYIAFRQKDEIIVIDDGSYRVWDDKDHKGVIVGDPIFEAKHDLGYCPARFFWDEPISLEEPDVKASPLSAQLESLDWFEFFHISKRTLDLMGAYPILSGYEQACDFSNAENGDYCDGGFLKDKEGHYKFDNAGMLQRCPKCGNKRIIGAGSFVEVPIPDASENQPDLRHPVDLLAVDRKSLDYNVDEEKRLRSDIITSVVGQEEIITDREAFNEQQVKANFESVTTVLLKYARGFEHAQTFVDETVCKLRYGKYFISASISYGTEFYIYTINELRERYKTAKESGASETQLDALLNDILETEYKNDPIRLRRLKVLTDLEPFRHLSREEVLKLKDSNLISAEDALIKLNFPSYIGRFERENMNVMNFGENIAYDAKIKAISDRLREYAKEQLNQQ